MPKAAMPPIRTAEDGHKYPVNPNTGKRANREGSGDTSAPTSGSEPVACRGGCGRLKIDGLWQD